jgi:hypothetical protein
MKGKAMAFNKVTFEEVSDKIDTALNELTELNNEIKQIEGNINTNITKLHSDIETNFKWTIALILIACIINIIAIYSIIKYL